MNTDENNEKRTLLLKSICLVITVLFRTHILITAPENILLRSYVWPVYIIYTTLTCILLAIAIMFTDKVNVAYVTLTVSAFFAVYDTCWGIYQSLFDVFIRTGVLVFVVVLTQRVLRGLFFYCRCCCCCYQ